MAFVKSISWSFCVFVIAITNYSYVILGVRNANKRPAVNPTKNDDLTLITLYRNIIDNELKRVSCTSDYNLLYTNTIFQDYSFWSNEIRTANNIANYITSMWRYKNGMNRSLVENEASIYDLAKTIALSSTHIYGSVVCFDAYKFQGRRLFCPYAYKNKTLTNGTVVRDLGKFKDYHTLPTNGTHPFIWWHVARDSFTNLNLTEDIDYYDIDLGSPNTKNATANGQYFNVVTKYLPINKGKWTTPYYDCFGGKIWMFTYLAPFYDQEDNFLGTVGFDIELDTIQINECDAPPTIEPEGTMPFKTVQFYGAHACQNRTTKCEPVHGKFTSGNYRCVCRKGYYFPNRNAKKKYFKGKDVMRAKSWKNESLFECLPCQEGCDECVDDTPCMYQKNMTLRAVFLVFNQIITAVAIALGVYIYVTKNEQITLGYFEDSVLFCVARSWLYHIGFILAFGSLLLKTWRIAVIFRLDTNKMVQLTDKSLLKYLMAMVMSIAVYLMIWTWTNTPEFEVKKTSAGYKYKRCVRGWFSNAIEIGELTLLMWGVWLCLRVRNTPLAYNESKYIVWSIYNAVFIMILVGLLRIVLDNFHNPDVSYMVDFLSTHVVATIMFVLVFLSRIDLLRKHKEVHKKTRSNSATSTTGPELRKSPFHMNRLVNGTLVCENDDERNTSDMEAENNRLREEVRSLNVQLAAYESKAAKESKRKGSNPEEDFKIHNGDFQLILPDSETESARDGSGFSDKRRRKRSAAAESTASNGSVLSREEKGGSLLEDIRNAGKQEHFLLVPTQNSFSEESETLTVMSNISTGST